MRFTDTKSETLNLRVSPAFKKALKEAAAREQRSMVNMLEVLLGDYCGRHGIILTGQKVNSPVPKRGRSESRAHAGAVV